MLVRGFLRTEMVEGEWRWRMNTLSTLSASARLSGHRVVVESVTKSRDG